MVVKRPQTREGKMFGKKSESAYRLVREGVSFKTVAHGEKTHLTEFHLAKGNVSPSTPTRTAVPRP